MTTIPKTVWALGIVSLLMDLSSELVHGLLPVYMTVVLGASMVAVGVVEGIAEATASILKVFSGALSDRLGRRKPIVVLGYGLAALSKPLFPLAGSVALVAAARFMDRVGKGIRGSPRDARRVCSRPWSPMRPPSACAARPSACFTSSRESRSSPRA